MVTRKQRAKIRQSNYNSLVELKNYRSGEIIMDFNYGGKEVRSGQSENGSSTIECSGIIGEDSNNGGTEVLREQLAESTGLLEEVQSSSVEASDSN